MSAFIIQAFNAEGIGCGDIACPNMASVGGHLGHLTEDWETVLVFRAPSEGGRRQLILRYDTDGFDL